MAILSLSSSPYSTTKATEWNGLLVDQNILQIPFSLDQRQLANSMGSLSCVLQRKEMIIAAIYCRNLAGENGSVGQQTVIYIKPKNHIETLLTF